MFVESRKLDDNVMRRVTNMNEADVLAGRTKAILAKHYVMYELIDLHILICRLNASRVEVFMRNLDTHRCIYSVSKR